MTAALHGNNTYCSDTQKRMPPCHFRHWDNFPVTGVQGGYTDPQVSLVGSISGSVYSRAVCQVTSLGESVGMVNVFGFLVWLSHLQPKCVGLGSSKVGLSEKSSGKQFCKKKLNSVLRLLLNSVKMK